MNMSVSDMEFRLLKLATRKLLDTFGSLKVAADLCRVKPTNLSQYQSFEHTTFMPIDVALTLERHAGAPILTNEMSRMQEKGIDVTGERGVRDEALDVPVAVGELLAFVCEATTEHSPDGADLSENEKRRYIDLRRQVEEELRELDAAVEQNDTLRRRRVTD